MADLNDVKDEAASTGLRPRDVLARYKLSDLKRADIDKLIRGHVVAMPNTGRQTPAEEASIADRLTRVFDRADAKTQPTGEESSIGLYSGCDEDG